jgi:hypothetical protein
MLLSYSRTGNDLIGSEPSGGSDVCISKYRHPVVLNSHSLDTARSGELKSEEFFKKINIFRKFDGGVGFSLNPAHGPRIRIMPSPDLLAGYSIKSSAGSSASLLSAIIYGRIKMILLSIFPITILCWVVPIVSHNTPRPRWICLTMFNTSPARCIMRAKTSLRPITSSLLALGYRQVQNHSKVVSVMENARHVG